MTLSNSASTNKCKVILVKIITEMLLNGLLKRQSISESADIYIQYDQIEADAVLQNQTNNLKHIRFSTSENGMTSYEVIFTKVPFLEVAYQTFISEFNELATDLTSGGIIIFDSLNPLPLLLGKHTTLNHQWENNTVSIDYKKSSDIISEKLTFINEDCNLKEKNDYTIIRKIDLLDIFRKAGLMVIDIVGDYQLTDYDEESSCKMIFILKKP